MTISWVSTILRISAIMAIFKKVMFSGIFRLKMAKMSIFGLLRGCSGPKSYQHHETFFANAFAHSAPIPLDAPNIKTQFFIKNSFLSLYKITDYLYLIKH